jgi:hypothetical protein
MQATAKSHPTGYLLRRDLNMAENEFHTKKGKKYPNQKI